MPSRCHLEHKRRETLNNIREDGTIIKAKNPTTIVKFNKEKVFIEGTYEDMTFIVVNNDKMIFKCNEPTTKKTTLQINFIVKG